MTSIEFIEQMYYSEFNGVNHIELFEQAKEMHKKEIIQAFDSGVEDDGYIDNAEQYYQETFVSKGSDDHISDISKMVELPKQYVNKLGNEDVPKLGYDADIREIALKNYPFGNAERNAFIAGYNKSKETLYTEEQMIDFAEWIFNMDINRVLMTKKSVLFEQYIQSLKQPKQ
jgi:hypothetical protein